MTDRTAKLPTMAGYLQVSTTAATRDAATTLARSAVAAGLAAGAQVVGPVTSVFVHLGEQGEGEEWQVYLKTSADRYDDLEAHLVREHPWDNPEVTATALVRGTQGYLDWLDRTTRPS